MLLTLFKVQDLCASIFIKLYFYVLDVLIVDLLAKRLLPLFRFSVQHVARVVADATSAIMMCRLSMA